MELLLSGQVLSAEPTRKGGALRVIVADGGERNAVVIAPPDSGIAQGELLDGLRVRAQVQMLANGLPTSSVVYMATEGWPEKNRGNGRSESRALAEVSR